MSIITQIALSLPREMARMNFMVSPNHLVALEVRPDGSVDNFYTLVLQRAPRRRWLSALEKSWLHARLNERPLGAFDADTHSLVDIVFCLSMCSSLRSQHKMHSLSRDFYEWVRTLRNTIVRWLAVALDWYTLHVYAQHHDTSRPPPSYRAVERRDDRKTYVYMHPAAVWSLLEKQAAHNLTLRQVMSVTSDHKENGSHPQNAIRWEALVECMYNRRLSLAWPHVNHLCMTADSSTHAYNDALLAIAYSWELEQACFPMLQFLVPGKDVFATEDELTVECIGLAARMKLERVAAYRQLQGISHMTLQLHARNINDYDVPNCSLAPVGEHERRVVVVRGEERKAFIVNTETRTQKSVLPDGLQDVPLLVLLLDQGSIGCASSGFVDHMDKMVLIRFEKIHRLIRDIKGPLSKCCNGAALKAQVYSSYIWNLQTKPWGSGWFGTVLQRALRIFDVTTNVQSAIFQKYLPRIAEELRKPYTTLEEQQAIYNYVCELPSIALRGEQTN